MAERILETQFVLTGKKEYIEGLEEITIALNRVCEAKRKFDALFEKAPNLGNQNYDYTSYNSAPQ